MVTIDPETPPFWQKGVRWAFGRMTGLEHLLEEKDKALEAAGRLCEEQKVSLRRDWQAEVERLKEAVNSLARTTVIVRDEAVELALNRILSKEPACAEEFEWQILWGYGFTDAAKRVISDIDFIVGPEELTLRGLPLGNFTYDDKWTLVNQTHEAGLHEMCHRYAEKAVSPAELASLAWEMAKAVPEATGETRAFLQVQLFGHQIGDPMYGGGVYGHAWPGALDGIHPADITAEDFAGGRPEAGPERGWRHLWVNLASYTMGQYQSGPRALPERLWPYLEGCFSGTILVKPYFSGGRP